MAKSFTKFTYAPDGTAVYKSTGKAMPATYEIKGSNVYSKGRKIGTISKRMTAKERIRVESAAKSRAKRRKAQARRMKQGKPAKPRKPTQKVPKQPKELPPPDMRDTQFPDTPEMTKLLLAERVRQAAFSIATKWMVNYIQRMDPEILWLMYQNGDVVLEIYFEYYENEPEGSKKPDYARLFIKRYQAYAGVEHGL